MDTRAKEHRGSSRLPFSTDEGLIGVVIRPESSNEIVAASMLNISLSGLRISAKRSRAKTYTVGESLVLTAFKGTADVRFSEPIGLEIRWVDDRPGSQFVEMGCELVYASAVARKVLDSFLEKEMKWKGTTFQPEARTAPGSAAAPTAIPDPVNRGREAAPASGKNTRFPGGWGVATGVVALLLLALVFLRVDKADKTLNRRLIALETRLAELREKSGAVDGIEKNLRSLGKQVDLLAKAADETRSRDKAFEERFDSLGQQVENLAAAAPQEPVTSAVDEAKPDKAVAETVYATHTVQKGENLFRISLRYRTSVEALCRLNDISPGRMLYAGQKLKVPAHAVGGSPAAAPAGGTATGQDNGARQNVAERAP